jgi:hypothetical protein
MREMQKAYDELQTVITPEHTELEERTREGQGVGVSRSAYSRVKCFFCEKGISSSGLAQTNHKRKHVREGMIVELRYTGKDYRPNSFIRPTTPRPCSRPGTTGGLKDDGVPWIDQVWVLYLGADLDEVS